jgi:hypothetical protein
MDRTLPAEYGRRLRKLRMAYREAVDRFTTTRDIREMQSAATEMKALSSDVDALLREFKNALKPKRAKS